MEILFDPSAWAGLFTLVVLEIVLGIDNLVIIAILADKLPSHQRHLARKVGLALALGTRIALLASIAWMASLTEPLFACLGKSFSGRDLVLILGGFFLLFKATREIHERLEGALSGKEKAPTATNFWTVIIQIILMDIVFSLDTVITAVGMSDHLEIMVAAIVIAVLLMLLASGPLMDFVTARPTVVMLCLGFLLLVGCSLIADGWGMHIPKGYLYTAIGFSALVETLNQLSHKKP